VVALVLLIGVAAWLSPWPGALAVRWLMDADAERAAAALEKHVPKSGVTAALAERYDAADDTALLDVYYAENASTTSPATVVWVHGGGWVSGRREHVGNYQRIIAGHGFTAVTVDYALAPSATYPSPVRQVNRALAYLVENASRLHVNPSKLVLAGDSAGAHITAQVANAVSYPGYAKALSIEPAVQRSQLVGAILYCGPFDLGLANFDGPFAVFLRTILRSYFGTKDFREDPRVAIFSVRNHVSADFPATLISAGNADPLLSQSRAMAEALKARGVRVDSLFFPSDYEPRLGHEYQFNLDQDAGKLALQKMLDFLSSL
jgi:acetyl esterase/lipase